MTNEMNYLNSLMSNAASANDVKEIPLDNILENPLNKDREISSIDELSEIIKEKGLQQPVVVKKVSEYEFMLISGHRRTRAIRKLTSEGHSYEFNSHKIFAKVPALVVSFDDPLDEELAVLVGNNHNDDTKKEKIRRCHELSILFAKRKEKGLEDGEKRKWIAKQSGFSERSVSNYLKEFEEEKHSLPKTNTDFDRFYTTLKKLASYKGRVDIKEVDPKLLIEMRNWFKDAKAILYPKD